MEKIKCDCGHLESDHSECTRGYSIDGEGKTYCYGCSLALDVAYLNESGKLSAYLSGDGRTITTWPGLPIAAVDYTAVRDFGYCRNQTAVWATLPDGRRVFGRGPGKGMFLRLRLIKETV
jgi:hypothetical protein